MAMPKIRRLNRLPKGDTPEALAARLPSELKTFDMWHYRDGLRDYLKAVADSVPEHLTHPVMNAAGLSAADWFRHALTRGL
jgi:hypothetical protein